MGWQVLQADEVLRELTSAEAAGIQRMLGQVDLNVSDVLTRTIAEVRDYIRSGGYQLDQDNANTLPLGLHADAIALTRWRVLISIPSAKAMQTDERKASAERALEKFGKIAAQEFAVEPPGDIAGNRFGSWNSENKILGRTHPVPSPQSQRQTSDGNYANPNAPEDRA